MFSETHDCMLPRPDLFHQYKAVKGSEVLHDANSGSAVNTKIGPTTSQCDPVSYSSFRLSLQWVQLRNEMTTWLQAMQRASTR